MTYIRLRATFAHAIFLIPSCNIILKPDVFIASYKTFPV